MKPIFLDTNIFLYAAGAPHALKSVCAGLVLRVSRGDLLATTNAEVVQEILHVYARRGGRKNALTLGLNTAALLPNLLPVTRADVLRACDLMDRYRSLSSRDAIHAATMLSNGIEKIVSVDPDFDVIREIERIPPDRA